MWTIIFLGGKFKNYDINKIDPLFFRGYVKLILKLCDCQKKTARLVKMAIID